MTSFGVDNTTKIKAALSQIFMENELLNFRCVNTANLGSCLEFLDVEHKIDYSHIGGFHTRDFVKRIFNQTLTPFNGLKS